MLHPDSVAVVFWLLFLLYYLFKFNLANDRSIIILSALFVLLAASKFTYIIFLPLFLLSFIFFNYKKSGWALTLKQLIKFLVITGVFLMALFPFLWTDSITFAKSFFGNIFMKSSGKGNSLSILLFDYLPSLITYPGLILAVVGLFLSFVIGHDDSGDMIHKIKTRSDDWMEDRSLMQELQPHNLWMRRRGSKRIVPLITDPPTHNTVSNEALEALIQQLEQRHGIKALAYKQPEPLTPTHLTRAKDDGNQFGG